ncbi:hypothetical protein [Candidatus Ichthyocystis sparus]|uniref:hypothetical protein n=1 Tax=Candidatus Ichthyocystis sparus TaxID=1561004 RepID=UPI000B86C6E7|nr:hypothetical protein [Candidatus Ichthyocystis sparus]
MYPTSSIISSVAASSGVTESGNDGGNEVGTTQGGDLQQVGVFPLSATLTDAVTTVGESVSTRIRGKASARKRSASAAVSSSAVTVGSDVLSSLGIVLSHESAQVVEDLLSKVDTLARRNYKNIVDKQLPSGVSDKLTVTGRAIWYFTYKLMCEDGFVSRCIGEYHCKHRPDFIRALPRIKVLSSSPDRNVLPLAGNSLSDFLSKLDGVIYSRVRSVFKSNWDEVSVTLGEESLTAVSCKDFIDVLETAGIPQLALSAMLIATARTRNSGGKDECTTLGVATDLTRSSPSSTQLLPSQSHHTEYESRLGSSLPLGEYSGAPSELSLLSSSQCVDLPGIDLHPDSAELVGKIFDGIRKFIRRSLSHSVLSCISKTLNSELSALEEVIWFRTYRELHLSKFMCRFVCMYHHKYHPNFIRALGSIRVLSSPSHRGLVPLSGTGLLDFLSRMDCATRKVARSMFDLEWSRLANKAFYALEDVSLLSNVSCENFIRVLDVVDIPIVAFPIFQRPNLTRRRRRRRCIESKTLESGSKCADDAGSGSGATAVANSSAISSSQLQPELLSPLESESLPNLHLQSKMQSGSSSTATSVATAQKPAVASPYCAPLCAMVLPECAAMVRGLFYEIDVLARSIYGDMISKQLPPKVSGKLSVTGRAIWYWTYMEVCKASFVFRCLGEYHAKHRPDFVRSLSKIQVLSDDEASLLDFLLRLDCAVRREVESIFNSCWSEVSVSLEEESLSTTSCRDFVRVLDVAGIPAVALSSNVESYIKAGGSKKGKGAVSATSVIDPTHSPPPSPQLSPLSQSNLELSSCAHHSLSDSQLDLSLPLGGSSGAPSKLIAPPSAGDSGGDFSSNLISAKRRKGSDGVSVSTHAGTGIICTATVGVPPVSTESSTLNASTISTSSSSVSLSIQCVDLLGVKLHPDSAKLVYDLFSTIRVSAKRSRFIVLDSLLGAMSSGLSILGRAIWCRTYRELHLLNFMAKYLCLYYSKYRPEFIRSLADIRVLSSSSDHRLVPLSGDVLLDFLSKLDCAASEEVKSIFDLNWDEVANKVFAELEDGSLDDVSCEDLVNVLDIAGIPVVAYSISQQYKRYQRLLINKSKKLGNGGKCPVGSTKSAPTKRVMKRSKTLGSNGSIESSAVADQSGSVSVTDTTSAIGASSGDTGSSLPPITESVAASTVSSVKPGSVSAIGTVSTVATSPGDDRSSLPIVSLISLPQPQSQPVLFSQTQLRSELSPLVTDSVAASNISDQLYGVSVADNDSTVVASPVGIVSPLPIAAESVAIPTVSGESSLIIRGDVLSSTMDIVAPALGVLEDELPVEHSSSFSLALLPSPPSELRIDDDVFSFSSSAVVDRVGLTTICDAPAFWGLEDELLSPPSSLSIFPASSSSYLSSSPSESGLDADVSSSSPELPISNREVVGLDMEGTISALGVLGESNFVISCEQATVTTTASSSVSTSATRELPTTTNSNYLRGPKKSFIMRLVEESFEIPTSSSNAVAGPSFSAPVDVTTGPLVGITGTAADMEGTISALGVLGESHFVTSREQAIVTTTASSSVSTSAVRELPMATSSNYLRGPKKSFIMRLVEGSSEVLHE